MNRIKLLLATIAIAQLGACGGGSSGGNTNPALPPATSIVSGTIRDNANAPISGVTISAYFHNNHTTVTTTTDANGAYSIPGLDATSNSFYTADYEIYAEKSGLGFYPSVSDPAASISKFDFNGLYRTVIRFLPPPTSNATGNNFTAYRAGDKVASLPRTGQVTSYASGDDFSSLIGVTWPGTRFTDNVNGTVTDHLTGLIWLKNADCYGLLNWCELSALGSHFISGVMEPLYFRRNGATGFPALRRHFEPDQGLELSLNN